jgi:monoamine oxidase
MNKEPEVDSIIDTLVIGAGLSGMYAASLLAQTRRSFLVLEARDRVGGRILCSGYQGYTADLGPSWYWPAINPCVRQLIRDLKLTGYPQYDKGYGRFQTVDGQARTIPGYPMEPEGWRLSGGMISLVDGLVQRLPKGVVRLSHPVCEMERMTDHVEVRVGNIGEAAKTVFKADQVILAIPPRLAAATILFTPDLSHELTQAMLRTGTWMAGQAKFFALYDQAEWRKAGLSGQAFSQYGPLGEVHDGSNGTGKPFGLTGFVGIPAAQRRDRQQMVQAILHQLQILYGENAQHPAAVFYKDWAMEPFTATEYDQRAAHAHPLFEPPSGKTGIWDGRVCFAGTETSDQYGGYLEGALASAGRAVRSLL